MQTNAQWVEQQPNDYYQRSMTWEQKPQEYEFVRETDVYWSKTLWRIIDVREKQNQYFYYPNSPDGVRGRKNLAYVLWDAIKAGEIELFEDDEMKIPLDGDKYKVIDGELEYLGTNTLFWVPMLSWQVRVLLAKKEAYCRENLVHMPTWEYAFNSFMYDSFIIREDNVWNRAIHDYLTGEDALLESERIEEEIMNISIDMWEY